MNNEAFEHHSLEDAQSIQRYLLALKDGLGQGRLTLRDSRGEVTLHPGGLLSLELNVQREAGCAHLELRLSWTETQRPGTQDPLSVVAG